MFKPQYGLLWLFISEMRRTRVLLLLAAICAPSRSRDSRRR